MTHPDANLTEAAGPDPMAGPIEDTTLQLMVLSWLQAALGEGHALDIRYSARGVEIRLHSGEVFLAGRHGITRCR